MKYTINLDESNYILSIGHTENDEQELDIESIDTVYLSCYKYEDGIATLDESKKAEQEEAQKQAEEELALRPTLEDLQEALNILSDIVLGSDE